MPAGRPTKYTPELLDKCYTYIEKWEDTGDVIPSQIGLQEYIDISNACLNDWKNDPEKTEFSRILDKILRMQQQVLINKGLTGDFNSNITKLVLGKHGFHEKVDQNQGGQPGNPIEQKWTVEFVNATPESKS